MATITGTPGDDRFPDELEGKGGADEIFGLAGNDTLIGFGGDDLLEGGAGADELFGSNGFDTASYRGSDGLVVVTLFNGAGGANDAEGDQLFSIEGVIGSAYGDYLYGDDFGNALRGEGGDDLLDGLGGADLLAGGAGNDALFGGPGADELQGGAGVDLVSYVGSAEAVTIDLAAGTGVGGDAEGDRLAGVERVRGTGFGDTIRGNAAANRLLGDTGGDVLSGRGGADVYWYVDRYDSNPKAPDLILDFSRAQGDRIDLRAIDANEQVDGNQAFRFVGHAPTTVAGQVRVFQEAGNTVIEADVSDAIAGAEIRIEVDPMLTFRAGDFVL